MCVCVCVCVCERERERERERDRQTDRQTDERAGWGVGDGARLPRIAWSVRRLAESVTRGGAASV